MNQKELRELIEFLKQQDIAEFELERGDVKVRIKRSLPTSSAPDAHFVAVPTAPMPIAPLTMPAAPIPTAKETTPPPAVEENLHVVHSPIVGTFYESPSPGSPPFVKVGDAVEAGQVLCIVEAMKLMNEIEADISGELMKKLVTNGQPIEYGQDLFVIRPK
jgi:acetyl-CoA carboxylase biotin carboxyl carrier protein